MKLLLTQAVAAIDSISWFVGKLAGWCALLLVLCTVWDVALRYVFQAGSVAVQELEWHLYAMSFLFGAAVTLQRDEHVRVDIFYARYSPRVRALVNAIGSAAFLIPFCVLIVYTSLSFVEMSWTISEGSPDPGGLPARYLIKACIPLGFAILLLAAISQLLTSVLVLLSRDGQGGEGG